MDTVVTNAKSFILWRGKNHGKAWGSAPGAPRHTGGLGEARGEAKRQFEREARGEGQRVPVACARCP